jgi:CBS domain-containing protein
VLRDFVVSRRGTLIEAIDVIERNHSRTAIVVDGEKVIGTISEGDIMRALLGGADVRARLADFVQVGFRYLKAKDFDKALTLMHPSGIMLIPVVDDDFRLKDVVTLREVLDAVLARKLGGA